MSEIEIGTKSVTEMTDEEILAEYNSYPDSLPDILVYREVQARKYDLASEYNGRDHVEIMGPGVSKRSILR